MSLLFLIAIFAILFFGILSILFSLKETRTKRILKEKNKKSQLKTYEATILKEIQDHIGYSFDLEKIIDIIISSLENIISYSTASSLVLKNDKLIFKTKISEPVSTNFLTQVKSICLKSLLTLSDEPLPELIEEELSGIALNESINSMPSSFFNIPLIVNKKIHGIISICSNRPHLYKEEEMTTLYKITGLANHALSRLQEIFITEKGKLTSLITSLEDGVFMVDVNNQITIINKAAKDILDLQKDNPTITQLLVSLPNSYNFCDKIKKTITLNQKIEEKDIQHGTGKTLNITITPVLDALTQEETKVIGASFLIHDVTLEKSLSKMKEDFTNIIVHELRSPLTSIRASTEMLTEQNNLTEEDKKHLINIIDNQTVKMLDEVATILDSSKLDIGLFTVQKTKGDFKKTIEETIESFRIAARNKSINLISHIDPFLPQTQFDKHHMRQAINNLLSNSLKFTPEGGTITVRSWFTPHSFDEIKLTPQSSPQKDEPSSHTKRDETEYFRDSTPQNKLKSETEKIFVSVSDTGSGIPKNKQHLLFSKFAQIKNTNGAVGTGLGLYIVKGIIEAHGGTISLESEPDKGTTIIFNIPIDATIQPSQAPPTPQKNLPIPEKLINPPVN